MLLLKARLHERVRPGKWRTMNSGAISSLFAMEHEAGCENVVLQRFARSVISSNAVSGPQGKALMGSRVAFA